MIRSRLQYEINMTYGDFTQCSRKIYIFTANHKFKQKETSAWLYSNEIKVLSNQKTIRKISKSYYGINRQEASELLRIETRFSLANLPAKILQKNIKYKSLLCARIEKICMIFKIIVLVKVASSVET